MRLACLLLLSVATPSAWGLARSDPQKRRDDSQEAGSPPSKTNTINPIYYLHVPKAGSSFATTVVHHACGDDIAEDVWVQEPGEFIAQWKHSCNRSRFNRFETGHDPLSLANAADISHVVVMMRDPSQRIMSGYYHDLHDCWAIRQKYNCRRSEAAGGSFKCDGDVKNADGHYLRDPDIISPLEYGRCVENCSANMLTGKFCGDPGPVDVDLAVSRIHEFGFVGITHLWDLSVCLWHKKFGGRPLPVELMNVRPGIMTSASGSGAAEYDTEAMLGKWVPRSDMHVWNAARKRFWTEFKAHGLTRFECDKQLKGLMEQRKPGNDQQLQVDLDHSVKVNSKHPIVDISQIFYLHIPKAGSSFATTVVHHACGTDIPSHVWVQEPSDFHEHWGTRCDRSRFGRFETGHDPLAGTEGPDELARVVTMVRTPSQRIISGYYHDLHDCWALRQKHNCQRTRGVFSCEGDTKGDDGRYLRDPAKISPVAYGQCVENCTANMLTGRFCGDAGAVDIDRAVDVVNKLGFVGLTDEWSLSVCLWHKRFGGRMLPVEFMNVRPGVLTATSGGSAEYATEELLGDWRPNADREVFKAAKRRFWREVGLHGLSREACDTITKRLLART